MSFPFLSPAEGSFEVFLNFNVVPSGIDPAVPHVNTERGGQRR